MKNTIYDLAIIGGGIVGASSAYYASLKKLKVALIEKDSVGSHASGFAYGGITPHIGLSSESPYDKISKYSYKLHKNLSNNLPKESGIDYGYKVYPNIELSINKNQNNKLKEIYENNKTIYKWYDKDDLNTLEPRLSENVLSGLVSNFSSGVEPYKLTLALAIASEKQNTDIINSEVIDFSSERSGIKKLNLSNGNELLAKNFLIAAGPWSKNFSKWFGIEIPVKPLKGQILRLKSNEILDKGFHWGPNYVTTKQDGLIWAGTTEEDVGFDENPSNHGLNNILESVLEIFPFLKDAELVLQTACLRPLSVDKIPIISASEKYENLYLASGTGRQGILLAPAMGKLITDHILGEQTEIDISGFNHKRFSSKV
jgi:glycine oxidase|tara:strand:+ start:4100 stop:5212 length:1113 start_codon:yes stop_codon:yes gene_type:complete